MVWKGEGCEFIDEGERVGAAAKSFDVPD